MVTIIIKDSKPRGRTRTNTEKELNHEWGTSSFKDEGDKDKCAFIERKLKKHFGADDSMVTAKVINSLKD